MSFHPARQPDTVLELPDGATVGDAMTATQQGVDITLAVRGGVPVIESEPLRDGEKLLLISAASGG